MTYRLLIFVVFSILLSACSTVNRGTDDHFRIDTVPQGAKVTTSIINPEWTARTRKRQNSSKRNRQSAKYIGCEPTPCAIKLPRRSEFAAKLEHPGYEPVEIFIRSSKQKGSANTSAVANLATASGTGFAVGGAYATFEALLTLGLQSGNASGVAASAAAAGLGLGVGMIAVDAAAGSNLNLFPNPVVIELAQEGVPTRKDPLVDLYRDMKNAEELSLTVCAKRKNSSYVKTPKCKEAEQSFRDKKALFRTLKKEQMDSFKASVRAAKAKRKTLNTK